MSAPEACKPISIKRPTGVVSRLLFAVRCLVDFQLATVVRFLKSELASMTGSVLDVGCGEMPFRDFLARGTTYTPIDLPSADLFGMTTGDGIVRFDGRTIPFADNAFDNVLCTEVLEHAEDHAALIGEMHRVLKPGGRIVVTIPFSARVHHVPFDFHRFTSFQLERLFSGFGDVVVTARGNDIAVIANKLIVLNWRLAKPAWLLAFVALLPITALFVLLANLSIHVGFGSASDPLGYAITARKAAGTDAT